MSQSCMPWIRLKHGPKLNLLCSLIMRYYVNPGHMSLNCTLDVSHCTLLCIFWATCIYIQYSSQVTSRVCALRGMRAREKLARAQGALEELRVKPKPLESWTIANLPARLLLRVLAQSWYSPYIKFASQNIVTCSYNISVATLYWTWLLCRSV